MFGNTIDNLNKMAYKKKLLIIIFREENWTAPCVCDFGHIFDCAWRGGDFF